MRGGGADDLDPLVRRGWNGRCAGSGRQERTARRDAEGPDTARHRTPDGFATTADACQAFLRAAGLERVILQKRLGTKEVKLIYQEGGTRQARSVPVPRDDRERVALSDDNLLTLARWAILVEEHYSRLRDLTGGPSGYAQLSRAGVPELRTAAAADDESEKTCLVSASPSTPLRLEPDITERA